MSRIDVDSVTNSNEARAALPDATVYRDDFVECGLELSATDTTLTVHPGICHYTHSGTYYRADLGASPGIGVPSSAVTSVYVDFGNESIVADGTTPSEPSLKIGEVDTTTDPSTTDDTFNRSPAVTNRVTNTERLFTRLPAQTLAYVDGSEYVVLDKDGEVDRDTDAGVVLNSALANMSSGGTCYLRAGVYEVTQSIQNANNPGVFLHGDGSSWSEGPSSVQYGTVLERTSSASTGALYKCNEQFQGARYIGFDGTNAPNFPLANSAGRDVVFDRCGFRGGAPNVAVGFNDWVQDCWIEFPQSGHVNIEVTGVNVDSKVYIEGNFIIDGQVGINITSETADSRIHNNAFAYNDRSIQFSSPLRDTTISGNTYRGTGRNPDGGVASVYYGFDELDNVRFENEVVNGAEDDGTVQTDHILFVEGSAAITNDVVFDVSYTNINGPAIDNNVPVDGYVFNGRVPDPETIDQSGTDGPISPTDITAVDTAPVRVDAGGTANTEVESIDGSLARDEQTVVLIHSGGEAVDLIHNDTNESNPLINASGTNETLSTNGDRAAYTYSEQAGKWLQSSPVVTQ